jgi:DEAD/DEAH box helicase domain-containing protein
MHDPVGSFLRIRDLYITYLETAFRIADVGLTQERRHLLEETGTLSAPLLVEPSPRYQSSGFRVEELAHALPSDDRLPGFDPQERQAFARLCLSGLLDVDSPPSGGGPLESRNQLYSHQAAMLKRGVQPGKPGIVTSGTGSGKTESFLLPVFAALSKEASSWKAPSSGYLQSFWWQDKNGVPYETEASLPIRPSASAWDLSAFKAHRTGENRAAAVRALILYPMNALVEDQLVRLRKALDSEEARTTFADVFNGNRIFLGRYTSKTPLTGFHRHPRQTGRAEADGRKAKLQKLLDHIRELWSVHDSAPADDDSRFLFPTVDGSELYNRWDMQETPPDLLITNISMLSAMLQREVDEPIFEKTRSWIVNNDDAYFYLVLDELHLQRGSAGTEVSYLLATLLERLGLNDPNHRHKLRILASSASLPTTGPEAAESLEYLWNMFGRGGLYSDVKATPTKDDWSNAVVAGTVIEEREAFASPAVSAISALANALSLPEDDVLQISQLPDEAFWRKAYSAICGSDTSLDLSESIRQVIEVSGKLLTGACWNADSNRLEATSITTLSNRLFGSPEHVREVRTLLLLRGFSAFYEATYPKAKVLANSFRIHSFFRNIDGLYAPASRLSASAPAGNLSVERGLSGPLNKPESGRFLQLLYCEACGEIFLGGLRGALNLAAPDIDLLPSSPDLENAPDAIQTQLVEDYSWTQFALFWQKITGSERLIATCWSGEQWVRAALDKKSGRLHIASPGENVWQASNSTVPGYAYVRRIGKDELDIRQRTPRDRGTGLPFTCPNCQTDYSQRRRAGVRLSPVRGFRPGFTKSVQLLASELFSVLSGTESNSRSKLISFSDSRQDAAKVSLDIERRHHEDLWRVAFVQTVRDGISSENPNELQAKLAQLKSQCSEAAMVGEMEKVITLSKEAQTVKEQLEQGTTRRVRIDKVLEPLETPDYLGPKSSGRESLRPLLQTFVSLGANPLSASGGGTVRADNDTVLAWPDLFSLTSGAADWRDASGQQAVLNLGRQALVKEAYSQLNEILFSKTYFALEETGLGYPVVRSSKEAAPKHIELLNTFLRVLADDYRYPQSKWETELLDWLDASSIRNQSATKRFATFLNPSSPSELLDEVLTGLNALHHTNGVIHAEFLDIAVPKENAGFWRCSNCGRVHMHRGLHICTRCFRPLPEEPSGTIEQLRKMNYLGKRVDRSLAVHGLHSEELTGQTDDPAERQRLFKNIVLLSDVIGHPVESREIVGKSAVIDLLAVTTTMEVGVDIGPLRGVFQANMPPQRFNYQQRVGRAGRRGQAFSYVLTLCRSRSHDLHYFRNVDRITNDNPPPPFINAQEVAIPKRLILKEWFRSVFATLRKECEASGIQYPGDLLTPPDIHGEFIPSSLYSDPMSGWRQRLQDRLNQTLDLRDHLIERFLEDKILPAELLMAELEPDVILAQLDALPALLGGEQRAGLAHSMAEGGLLPMYGLPTRMRNLYHGYKNNRQGGYEWLTIDRDIDVALHEFAPGQVLIKDKLEHRCVGFTGPLGDFRRHAKQQGPQPIAPLGAPFDAEFILQLCNRCGTWTRPDPGAATECPVCSEVLSPEDTHLCRTPSGFRTDFRPSLVTGEFEMPRRYRSVAAEAVTTVFLSQSESHLAIGFSSRARTYRINSGDVEPGAVVGMGFTGIQGVDKGVRGVVLSEQFIPRDYEPTRYVPDVDQVEETFWLASGKVTDSVLLSTSSLNDALQLGRVAGSQREIGVRSAAISATFLLSARAALDLDADPEEFECIEPRLLPEDGGNFRPLLQITDRLINGSGYSRRLTENQPGPNSSRIAGLVRSVTTDKSEYPLSIFAVQKHREECDKSCYQCLQRYGNQAYHSLLDWRLGLAYLRALDDSLWQAGLDGSFQDESLVDWPDYAASYCKLLASALDGEQVIQRVHQGIPYIHLQSRDEFYVAVHPLWNTERPAGSLRSLLESLPKRRAFALSTFELARRMFAVRQALLNQQLQEMVLD